MKQYQYGTASTITFPLVKAIDGRLYRGAGTIAAAEIQLIVDGASVGNPTNDAVEINNSGVYGVALTGTEMQGGNFEMIIADPVNDDTYIDQIVEFQTINSLSAAIPYYDANTVQITGDTVLANSQASQLSSTGSGTFLGTPTTTGSLTTLTGLSVDALAGRYIYVYTGPYKGQFAKIVSNDASGNIVWEAMLNAPESLDNFIYA